MNAEQEFDRRIAAIHGLGGPLVDVTAPATETPMDVRHAEFAAMADVFLGADFDPTKRSRVEDLQRALHRRQAELARRHEQGEMSAEEFVAAANGAIGETFKEWEKILGEKDFRALFGVSSPEAAGLIDRAAFLGKSPSVEAPAAPPVDATMLSTIYANFCRVTVTPEDLVIDFGLNTLWMPSQAEPVQLSQRVIMNYLTAKRLLGVLHEVVQQHEDRYGSIELNVQRRMSRAFQQLAPAGKSVASSGGG